MRLINLKYIISLLVALFLFSCSEKLPMEEVNLNLTQEITANYDDDTDENFVSSKQALEIAEKFFNREPGAKTRAFANAKVEMVRDEKNSNNPAMHVVTYPEGGFVIVSANKDYYPILAYSDENSFDLANANLSGVSVWLEETQAYIRASEEFDVEIKAQIRSQWLDYEEANNRNSSLVPQTRGQLEFDNRINQLSLLYPYTTTQYQTGTSLNSANISYDTYNSILNLANSLGSPPEYTIVVIRDVSLNKGPLLATAWNQRYPFNYFCPPNTLGATNNHPAGCAAVAMGQIMNYHKKPALVTSPTNHKYNWNNMAENATSSLPVLLRAIGVDIDTKYGPNGSDADLSDVETAFSSYGYYFKEVSQADAADLPNVRAQITANKPVYMLGYDWNNGPHAWVCDGVQQFYKEYFVEFYYNGYYTDCSYYTPSNPGLESGSKNFYYHQNWGWGGEANGWFFENDVNPSASGKQFNFNLDRYHLYITPL